MLLVWAPMTAAAAWFGLQPLGGNGGGPLAWMLTPLSSNPFAACRAAETVPLTPPPGPSKASLFINSAHAQEALPDQQQQQEKPQQPQQQQQQQLAPDLPTQQTLPDQIPNAAAPSAQDGGDAESGSTGGGFSLPFDIVPAIGCDELGFGDLVDGVLDESGERAWVINRYGAVYHSADSGRSWTPQRLPDFNAANVLSGIAADDAGRNLVVAARDARYRFTFYRSDNGGQTWRVAPEMLLDGTARRGPVLLELTGLAIGGEADGAGQYVVATFILEGPQTEPMVWRDSSAGWLTGFPAVDVEMVQRLRTRGAGIAGLDLGATGPAVPPILYWARPAGGDSVTFALLTQEGKGGPLTPSDRQQVEYRVGAGDIVALAASDDGDQIFAATPQAILRGDSRDDLWTRFDLRQVNIAADFSLAAIDVAGGNAAILAVGRNALVVSETGGDAFFQPALSRYPAPWFYLVLLSGPAFALFLMRPGRPETVIVEADESKGLSDRALSLKDPDALNLRAYAEGLSDLLRNAETRPPLVIGVTGPWGSGKSSVMQMLSELLARRQMPVVWFNAWHHQSEEHLLASLLSNIRRQGIPGMFTRPGLRLRWRLTVQRLMPHEPVGSFLTSWLLLLLGVALVSGAVALWVAPPVPGGAIPVDGRQQVTEAGESTETPAQSDAQKVVAAIQGIVCDAGSKDCNQLIEASANLLLSLKLGALLTFVLGLVPLSRLKQVALVTRNFDPAKLMTSMMPASRNPKLDEQLSFRHGFGEELRATIAALAPYRLVIFIDDLDRCRPENVAAVLEAVNFVVSAAECYVVLGMDRTYVLRAIRQEFEKFIEMEREERTDPALGSPEEDKGRPRDFAEHYLEKLVNLMVSVPKMDPQARARLMETLASRPSPGADPAPAFDWLRWARRVAAIAAILAALLGPAFYVASLSPPAQPQPVGAAALPAEVQPAAPTDPDVAPSDSARVVVPEIPTIAGAPAAQSTLFGEAGPLALVLGGLLALAGFAWAIIRAVSVPANLLIRDSKTFKTALRVVEPGLAGFMTTPRRAKRFVNRLRMFGAMLRSAHPDLPPEREAELDRATVEAGALHTLARELVLSPAAGTPPTDPAQRALWDKGRKQIEEAQQACRAAMARLYQSIDGARRPLVDSLFWRMWQMADGASPGEANVIQAAESARAAVTPALSGKILAADGPDPLAAAAE